MAAKDQSAAQSAPVAGWTYGSAKADAEERERIELREQNAEIAAQSAVLSKNGSPMVNLRWKIADGTDQDKVVFDRLIFHPNNIWRIDQFCKAIGRDPATEFGDNVIDLPFVSDWAESVLGEMATIKIGLDKGSTGDDGTVYPPKPEVKKYLPYGNAKDANALIDLD